MDISSLQRFGSHSGKLSEHPMVILKKVLNDGDYKVFQDKTGHAERIEIVVPEGKIVIIKDYEQVPTLAHYKKVDVFGKNDESLGSLEIFFEDRTMKNGTLRFFENKSQIGTGHGDIGIAIASQLLTLSLDPRLVSDSSIDPEVIASIKRMLQGSR